MLTQSFVIAQKEILDAFRDVRSMVSALVYALMGPMVVRLVSLTARPDSGDGAAVLIAMMSVFTLVAAFVGGMNIAMDTVAGERERRSLLPLLLSPVSRIAIAVGKWLAVSFFAVIGLIVNLAGFAGLEPAMQWPQVLVPLALGILPLALFAASLQFLISTVCRAVKEAQTYLSLVVFLPMGVGMFLVFYPKAAQDWLHFFPVTGQLFELQQLMSGKEAHLIQTLALGLGTVAVAALFLMFAANRLRRDEIIYGN
ncbi:MAG TPA: ABC transporter permease subunit [Bryobacteraceae bacterium]|nr:ABC transporter permease subunit [Bryobacteraceae bacterium]